MAKIAISNFTNLVQSTKLKFDTWVLGNLSLYQIWKFCIILAVFTGRRNRLDYQKLFYIIAQYVMCTHWGI